MFTAYPPALPELEQAVAATPVPEEIEEKVEAAEIPESEPIPEETDNMAAEAMEPEPSQEDAGDIFAEAIEEADAEEGAGDEVESAVQEELDASLDDLDLEFDIDTASEEIKESFDMEPSAEETPTEDVSLEDLDLDFDEAPEEEMSVEGDAIEDLDLDLDFDEAPEEETSAEGDTTSEKLDLSDLELSMESELEAETDEDELDLDLDLDSEPEAGLGLTEDQGDTDSEELDFSDFEETVMMDSPPKSETGGVSDELGEELELDLDLEMADDALPDVESALPSMKKEDVELEDLDFELDMELEGEAVEDIDAEHSEDVDLSDIEKMLEGDGTEHETVSLVSDLDNIETEVEKWKESPDTDDLMDQTGEIDLSDIMIDADDDDLEEDIEDVELELDIGEASEPVIAAGGGREPENIDISGFDEFDIPAEGDQVQGHFSGGDIELEFEIDGDADDLDTMATISDAEEIGVGSETIANAEPLVGADDAPTKKREKKKKPKKIKSVRKSGILRPVMLLLLLILLPLAAVVLLDRVMDMNVPFVTDYLKQVPYLNQVMKPEMRETGEISVDNISSKFIDNTTHGKLFIITGTAKNEFSESRKYIKIQGSLFSAGKTLAKEVTVYGGNVLTDQDLSEMSLTDINQRLSNRFGDKKSNFDVKPGKSIPFMVVFSDLPESLEEFTIEVSGSFPATKQQ